MNRRPLSRRRLAAGLSGLALLPVAARLAPAAASSPEGEAAATPSYAPHTWGDPDAPVSILEFSSYTCGHCARFHQETLPTLRDRYIEAGRANLTLVDFPLDNIAGAVSLITHCAPEAIQKRLVDIFFADQDAWMTRTPRESITGIARLAGMSKAEVDACLENETLYQAILDRRAEADARWDISGTPTFVINGQKHTGSYRLDDMTRAIDAALEATGG
ncbi:thioredoxin domain-containing protein [Roseospira goensis]|uniref:Protein-disulfide isomerase n=1 Tax=Roseospira goensis TaxID=391922 RepID=A0A7W6RZY7_9PROT|nr:protein-disulfide isomerase [Roseospira goensis]